MIPTWLAAGLWGLAAGSATVVGALIGYHLPVSRRVIAGSTAFGSGVLISALSIDLMEEAFRLAGFGAAALGFLVGALAFTLANLYLARQGARHRKRSGDQQPSEDEHEGSGLSIAVGSLLDGVPEAVVIGISMIGGEAVSAATVAAVCLANLPEGLSSAAGMRRAQRSPAYVFGVWGSIALATGVASLAGYTLFAGLSPQVIAITTAVAAGAVLAMLADTMIPEAFAEAHDLAGLITAVGFLAAFFFAKLGA